MSGNRDLPTRRGLDLAHEAKRRGLATLIAGNIPAPDGNKSARRNRALEGGTGYDLHLGRSFALSAFFHVVQLRVGGRTGMLGGTLTETPTNPRLLHAGVGLHYY